jgi:Na+-translocating ferredoxin:NAD+ oxidoreductase RnfA subunit
MSYISIIFSFVFMNNVIMNAMLGIPDSAENGERRFNLLGTALLFALSVVSSFVGWILWTITRRADYVFLPAYCLYFLLLSAGFEVIIRHSRPKISTALSVELRRIEYSGVAFGVGAIIGQAQLNPLRSIIAGVAAVCGYAAAHFLLRKIMERLELSDVPPIFRGAPAMLLNAGLVSLAIMAIDQALFRNLPL